MYTHFVLNWNDDDDEGVCVLFSYLFSNLTLPEQGKVKLG